MISISNIDILVIHILQFEKERLSDFMQIVQSLNGNREACTQSYLNSKSVLPFQACCFQNVHFSH